jgi:hypothetical protein
MITIIILIRSINYIPINISIVMRNNITSMVKTIKINDDIHARLLRIGSMGETFEDVIKKLLDFYENKNKK